MGRQVQEKFGSMAQGVLTLYGAVTGGEDWQRVYEVAELAGPLYGVLFFLFTFVFMFAMFNVIIAAIVEKAVEAAAPDREALIMAKRKKTAADAKELKHMCELMDVDGSGDITWNEISDMLESMAFVTYMETLGLEVDDVRHFFELMAGST